MTLTNNATLHLRILQMNTYYTSLSFIKFVLQKKKNCRMSIASFSLYCNKSVCAQQPNLSRIISTLRIIFENLFSRMDSYKMDGRQRVGMLYATHKFNSVGQNESRVHCMCTNSGSPCCFIISNRIECDSNDFQSSHSS